VTPTNTQKQPDRAARRLPVRWLVIISISVACGLTVGLNAGLGAGLTAGAAALVALHKITD
jgi:hypothetical protein